MHLDAAPAWRDSLNQKGTAMSMFEGGFLPDFISVLQFWHDRGVRMFLFDFADLTAATPHAEATLSKDEIVRRNSDALRDALAAFRRRNPDIVLEAFNGFGGSMDTTTYPFPFKDPVDLRWLAVFDALYCGDPRPGDVPEMSFWRTLDIYSDHQARRYEQAGVPLERIDTTSFMPGKTGTIYRRAFAEWKGSLLLMLARSVALLDDPARFPQPGSCQTSLLRRQSRLSCQLCKSCLNNAGRLVRCQKPSLARGFGSCAASGDSARLRSRRCWTSRRAISTRSSTTSGR